MSRIERVTKFQKGFLQEGEIDRIPNLNILRKFVHFRMNLDYISNKYIKKYINKQAKRPLLTSEKTKMCRFIKIKNLY